MVENKSYQSLIFKTKELDLGLEKQDAIEGFQVRK